MDEQLFTMIGRLYVEALNSQRVVELLQNKIKEKDEEIKSIKDKEVNGQ